MRLRLSPIDVGPVLSAALWGEVTAVLTSATVPPRLVERVGLEGFETSQLNVGSPFDYRAHALLYVARHLPDRRAPQAEAALHEELALLIDAAGGRTLALFTSRRATEEAAAALAPDLPYTLLLQGELPKGRLLEEFAGRRDLVPLRHPRLLAGRRHPGPGAVAGDAGPRCRSPGPTIPCSRPAGPGPAAAPSNWSTSPGPPPCWPRGRAASSAPPTTAAWSPCSTRAWPRPATGTYCCPPCRPCGARSSATEVAEFLRAALAR